MWRLISFSEELVLNLQKLHIVVIKKKLLLDLKNCILFICVLIFKLANLIFIFI